MKRTFFVIGRVVSITAVSLFLLVVTLTFLIGLPSVQSKAARWATKLLENQLETHIEIGEISLNLPAEAVLSDVVVYDQRDIPMLKATALRIDFLTFSLWRYLTDPLSVSELSIRYSELVRPELNIYRMPEDSILNIQFLFQPRSQSQQPGRRMVFDFSEIHLVNARIDYTDSTRISEESYHPGRIDFQNVQVRNLTAELGVFIDSDGRLSVDMRRMRLREALSGFRIEQLEVDAVLDTVYTYHEPRDCYELLSRLRLSDLYFESGDTEIRGDVTLWDDDLPLKFDAEIDERIMAEFLPGSQLEFATLKYFLKNELPVDGTVSFAGIIVGDLNKLRLPDFRLAYGQSTVLAGDMRLLDLSDPEKLELDIALDRGTLSFQELQNLLPGASIPPLLKRLSPLNFTGNFKGQWYDFNTQIDLNAGEAGKLTGNVHLRLPRENRPFAYEGFVQTRNLDVDRFGLLPQAISNRLNFSGEISGRGNQIADLDTRFNATIRQSQVLGREIDSAYFNVVVRDGQVMGLLKLNDTEGYADLEVDINLASEPETYRLVGGVRNFDLQHYGLLEEPLLISGSIDIDLQGQEIDDVNGTVELRDTYFFRQTADSVEIYEVPELYFSAESDSSGQKRVELSSSIADGFLRGNLDFGVAAELIGRLGREARLFFANNDSLTQAYYAAKSDSLGSDTVEVLFTFELEEKANEVFRYFRVPFFVRPGASVLGELTFNPTIESAEISVLSDSLRYQNLRLGRSEMVFDLFKATRSDFVVADVRGTVRELEYGDAVSFDSATIRSEIDIEQLNASLFIDQANTDNTLTLQTNATFEDDGRVVLSIDSTQSSLRLTDLVWRFNQENQITFLGEQFLIDNFALYAEGQRVRAEGEISEDSDSRLVLNLDEVDIHLLNELFRLQYNIYGPLNLQVGIAEVLGTPRIDASGTIRNFTVEDYRYGNLLLNAGFDRPKRRLRVAAQLVHDEDAEIRLRGAYRLDSTDSPLDFVLETQGTVPLDYIYPFVRTQIYGIEGRLALNDFTVRGSFDDLEVLGTGAIRNAKFGVEYFQTAYTFDGDVQFLADQIQFERITLYDRNRNTAQFFGTIYHESFRDFQFDLQLERAQNFLLINTTQEDNPLFYGKIVLADGVASITGDLTKLNVTAFAVSGAGSVLKIPISGNTALQRPDFIRFVGDRSPDRSINTGLQGFELNITALVNDEATVELIFDEKVGDIIRGRGNGALNLVINQQGEFSMSGDYEITSGDYLFTARNIVNKRFIVREGGHITWTGDPYEASLDLTAYYPVNADIRDLLGQDQSLRVPVNVIMNLEGSLLQPQIGLDIEIANLNEQNALQIANYLRSVTYDEQELNKQVFSLMVFGRFSPINADIALDLASTSTGVTSSISELLSNQFNYWLSQALGDKVSVGVGTSNFQDLNLLVSARLFNDRVTIERDGTLVSAGSNFSIGNISLYLKLLPNPNAVQSARRRSELVLEVFTRENIDFSFEPINQAGLGVFYKRDFGRLSEIFGRRD